MYWFGINDQQCVCVVPLKQRDIPLGAFLLFSSSLQYFLICASLIFNAFLSSSVCGWLNSSFTCSRIASSATCGFDDSADDVTGTCSGNAVSGSGAGDDVLLAASSWMTGSMFLICLPGSVVEGLVTRDCVPKESLDCWLGAVRRVERRGGIFCCCLG